MYCKKIYCKVCKKEKTEQNFYKGFKECKECVGNYLNKLTDKTAFEEMKRLLQESSYVVNEGLLHDIFFGDSFRELKNSDKLGTYLKRVNSLPQYKEYKCKIAEEKSDLDFINEDINQLKAHIQHAINIGDFNTHNKWMNCLRDAFEIREKLSKKQELTIEQIDNLSLDWDIDITKDQVGEDICRIPIFINGHFTKSIFMKYVDGKYEPRTYFISTTDVNKM